jgi:hypothetical protein
MKILCEERKGFINIFALLILSEITSDLAQQPDNIRVVLLRNQESGVSPSALSLLLLNTGLPSFLVHFSYILFLNYIIIM